MKQGFIITILLILIESIHWIDAMKLHRRASDNPMRYSSMIDFNEVWTHLTALESIAKASNGNRAIRTIGFNRSVDYIYDYLTSNSNLQVKKSYFVLRTYQQLANPTFSSVINGVVKSHIYSTTLSVAEFYQVQYSTSISLTSNTPITAIPNVGCTDDDYLNASPSPSGIVVLVKRGDCSFEEKARLATKYKVAALLIYNDGTASDRIQPISISLGQNNLLPALFLSYTLGQTLVTALSDQSKTVSVRLTITTDTSASSIANICADTPTGDPTQTIVIGSHSDSVTAGPGINDNGSGTAANLVLATTLARLLQSSSYPLYKYRVRFCWWGAEEVGLLGSKYHVTQAKSSSIVGERLSDYLININLDMLGSPNFIFGIYNGATAPTSTPAKAKPGSLKVSTLFQTWFDQNKFPWDNTNFDGRSDYGPFLAEGVVCGGLFSGADGTKTLAQRSRYEAMLGSGLGGTAGIRLDQCYHKNCDDTKNINKFALEKMVQASAAAIEKLATEADLNTWLYPTKEIEMISKYTESRKYPYDSINEYFGLPYD